MVGAGRSHPGALRRGLRPGEPAGPLPRLSQSLQRDERPPAGDLLRRPAPGPVGQRGPLRPTYLPSDAGPVQRDLLRAGASGALPRVPAGGRRRPDRAGRQGLRPHHRRTEAGGRHPAPGGRRLHRPPRAQQRLAPGHARHAGGDPLRRRGGAEHARLRGYRIEGSHGVPAPAVPPPAGRRAEDAQRRHLVVRSAARAGVRPTESGTAGHRPRLQRPGPGRDVLQAAPDGRPHG